MRFVSEQIPDAAIGAFATAPYPADIYGPFVVVNQANYSVPPHTDSENVAEKLNRAGWSGISRQLCDRGTYPTVIGLR